MNHGAYDGDCVDSGNFALLQQETTTESTTCVPDYLLFPTHSISINSPQQLTNKTAWSMPSTTLPATPQCDSEHANPGWLSSFTDDSLTDKASHVSTQDLIAELLQDCQEAAPQMNELIKKPGRKPMQEEQPVAEDDDPKLKRKAQNRAAQRAFRERKERYVRDLEVKIKHIQDCHAYATSQLSQENQYLRNVIRYLEAQVCTLKGLPASGLDNSAAQPWVPDTLVSTSKVVAPYVNITTTAPFTLSPLPPPLSPLPQQHLSPMSGQPSHPQTHTQNTHRVRPIAIAPAPPENTSAVVVAARPLVAKRKPTQMLLQQGEASVVEGDGRISPTWRAKKSKPKQLKKSAGQRSPVAMYVSFSPTSTHDTLESEGASHSHDRLASILPEITLFETPRIPCESTPQTATSVVSVASSTSVPPSVAPGPDRVPSRHASPQSQSRGSGSGSRSTGTCSSGSSSSSSSQTPALVVPATDDKEKNTNAESENNERMQLVWRRLNLYGRFADFDFDQICKVAQMAGPRGRQMRSGMGATGPHLEDWELDKMMHQMDPDHL